jgi:hypothetical protein
MAAAPSRTAAQHLVQPAAWAESQFAFCVPSVVQRIRFAPLPTVGQLGALQAPVAHVRSHAQAAPQSTVSHASVPEHVTMQVDPAAVQVQPDGQVTWPQLVELVHSARQVFFASSQVVQSLGQLGTTQKPLVHTRLPSRPMQSACVEHLNESEGRSTKHATSNAATSSAAEVASFIPLTIIALVGERGRTTLAGTAIGRAIHRSTRVRAHHHRGADIRGAIADHVTAAGICAVDGPAR